MRDDVMWAWDYELRTLGSWPGERYTGHNVPVEVVTKADHDAALRRAKAEVLRAEAKAMRHASTLYGNDGWRERKAVQEWADELDARAAQIENEATK